MCVCEYKIIERLCAVAVCVCEYKIIERLCAVAVCVCVSIKSLKGCVHIAVCVCEYERLCVCELIFQWSLHSKVQ